MAQQVAVEIAVDRFTTIRKVMPKQVVVNRFGGQRALYVPEFEVDQQRGAPQVDPRTHIIKGMTPAEPVEIEDQILPKQEVKLKKKKKKQGAQNLMSHHHRKVKMYKCTICGAKSEDREQVRKHVKICKEVNE